MKNENEKNAYRLNENQENKIRGNVENIEKRNLQPESRGKQIK